MELAASANASTSLADKARQLLRQIASWFGMAAADQMLPRKHCHFTTIALKGVPRRHAENALRLRLQQLGLFGETGFAWRLHDEVAQVWYWDDQQARGLFPTGRNAPWPEPMWRHPIANGVRLVACSDGYELEGLSPQGIYRSRWFAQRPSSHELEVFCRDLGLGGQQECSTTPPVRMPWPDATWRISSALAPTIPVHVWATASLVLVSGLIAAVETAQIVRLSQDHKALQSASEELRTQSGQISALESELAAMAPTLDVLRSYLDAPRQTRWLADLADHDVIGSMHDVYLVDWTYGGNRITATLQIGPKARSADVIARLERSGLFSDISLIPDPPANSLRLLLKLADDSTKTADGPVATVPAP